MLPRVLIVGAGARALAHRLTDSGDDQNVDIPWRIENKYYTATVDLRILEAPKSLSEAEVEDVPALVFSWNEGDTVRPQILDLVKEVSLDDLEVKLAVGPSADEDLDAFLMENGFEYTEDVRRVVDALSTIMWPNMRQLRLAKAGKSAAAFDDAAAATALLAAGSLDDSQAEMDGLERWLEYDDSEDSAPSRSRPQASGFDDDFADFVSADPNTAVYASLTDDDDTLPTREEVDVTRSALFSGEEREDEGQDLSHVLSALQGMKDEIAGMQDEGERRRAAARVALGLVYGLER